MASHLDKELNSLKKELLSLSSTVELNLSRAVRSLREKNELLAKEVKEEDKEIDLKEVEVEEECLKILALHQPVAVDLRFVIACLKINNDLERIGDLAVGIAKRGRNLITQHQLKAPFDYEEMARKTKHMLSQSLNAFVTQDLQLAKQVCKSDDEVDALNKEAYNKVFQSLRESAEEQMECLIHYLQIANSLERIADYATNIAEDVIYMVEGKIIRHGIDQDSSFSK